MVIPKWTAAAPDGDAPCGRSRQVPGAAGAARARSRGGDSPAVATQPASGHGSGVGLLLLAVTLAAMGPAAWAESKAVQDATVINVTLRGDGAWGLVVEFARSVPDHQPDYSWSGVTDISGRLVLTIPATDPSLVSGDYQARAVDLYGEVVGEWSRIPVDRGRSQALELVLGSGEVRRLPAGLVEALVAHYRLDGDARDASGAYHGTPSGVEPGEDRFGNQGGALVFQGADDRIDLPHQVLDGVRDVSISFWLKTTKAGSQAVLSAANRSNDNEHIVYLWDQRTFHFLSHGRHSHQSRNCVVGIPPIADGRWHHIVVVRNAAGGNADFYVDGVGRTGRCGSLDYRTLTVEAGGLIIGQEQDRLGGDFDPNQVLEGSLDDLRIYDKALSAAEVQTLLGRDPEEPEPPVERSTPLVAYYPFDGDARDASGNGHHGIQRGTGADEDRFGNRAGAVLFQGTRDRIDLPHEVLDGLRDVSISFWLKTTRTGEQAILGGANQSQDNEYLFHLLEPGRFQIYSHGRAGRFGDECPVIVEPIADGRWHHIVWVRNASEGYSDIYLDGVGQTNLCRDLEYRDLVVAEGGLILGQDQDRLGGGFAADQAFQGSLDDLWIYDRALTASEVQALRGRIRPGAARPAAPRETAVASGLEPNAPNPFNTSTWVPYRLAAPGPVRLEIYNMLRQRVRVLVDEFQAAGFHRVHWDARDQGGAPLAAGVYLARLAHPEGVHSRRLLYLE